MRNITDYFCCMLERDADKALKFIDTMSQAGKSIQVREEFGWDVKKCNNIIFFLSSKGLVNYKWASYKEDDMFVGTSKLGRAYLLEKKSLVKEKYIRAVKNFVFYGTFIATLISLLLQFYQHSYNKN